MNRFYKFGHRGARGYEPENTLRSFHRALDLGADGIELDVRLSKDNIPVVIHDHAVDTVSNGHGFVRELSFSRLRELDFGKGERIPTLENIFEVFGKKTIINVELKEGGLEKSVISLIVRFKLWDSVIVSAFDECENEKEIFPTSWDDLFRIQRADPKVQIALLARSKQNIKKAISFAKIYNIKSIHVSRRSVIFGGKSLVEETHNSTKSLFFVYTVNNPIMMRYLRNKLNIDGVFTDYLDII